MTKYMTVLYTRHLQTTLSASASTERITALALHPGIIATPGAGAAIPSLTFIVMRLIGIPLHQGAYTTLFAATSPRVREEEGGRRWKGAYVVPFGEIEEVIGDAKDVQRAEVLWDATEGVKRRIFDGV